MRTRSLNLVAAIPLLVMATGMTAVAGPAQASAPQPVSDPAALVNPMIGTSGSNDMFPGPDTPFGMMQWSPDTYPDRPDGGGYEHNDSMIRGFSLTHISGPGCGAYGDVPILPTVGAVGSSPGSATETFSHSTETAQAGYYAVSLGDGVTAKLTDATRAGIGQFTFPATTHANMLLKLTGSQSAVDATSARVVSSNEVAGSVTAGHFCGAPSSWERDYTLHFDIRFSQPFTASGTWGGTSAAVTPGSRTVTQHPAAKPAAAGSAGQQQPKVHGVSPRTAPSVANPGGMYLTFDTTASQTVTAKVGISFTSDANAALNLQSEIPGWDFSTVRAANHAAWNRVLSRIAIAGGTRTEQVKFYTALYHALLHPNVFSDVNGQYTGFDGKLHMAAPGHAEYANYSGWDIYRSQVQLAAMVAPQQTSDSIRSMLNDYQQTGMLPKWNLGEGESYVMVGDPADPIIAGAYAFGARDFSTGLALAAMRQEATVANNVRPGLPQLAKYGYLPYDASYGCCNFYGPVSTQQEYDTADYAIASLARATGQLAAYRQFASMAQSWQNVFDAGTGYMRAKLADGNWLPGFTPSTGAGFVEGTSAQYTPMVPFNLKAVIAARGGNSAWVSYLDSLMSDITHPSGTNANLSNEPSLEIPYEYDYAGEPYRTQQVIRQVEQQLYFDAPVGQFGNDDLGAMSSAYVWDELGFYPETPGAPYLALSSPVFPQAVVHLATGKTINIDAPGAAPAAPYIQHLAVNGQPWNKAWLDYNSLSQGATLSYDLGSTPDTSWAASPAAAPPSDATGEAPAIPYTQPGSLTLPLGSSRQVTIKAQNVTGQAQQVSWQADVPAALSMPVSSGSFPLAAGQAGGQAVTISPAGTSPGSYLVPIHLHSATGASLPTVVLPVEVVQPGSVQISTPSAWLAGGQSSTLTETFTNSGDSAVHNVQLSLSGPSGWALQAPSGTSFAQVAPGASVQATWKVTAPQPAQPIVTGNFAGTATYTWGNGNAATARSGTALHVTSPVQPPYRTYASTSAHFGQYGSSFAIDSDGTDMWTANDEYGAIYLPGGAGQNCVAVVKVTRQADTDPWAKSGIVMRNDIAKAGQSTGYVMVAVTPGNGYALQWDGDGSGYLDANVNTGTSAYPTWLKLVRNGGTYTGYYSADGSTWTKIASATLSTAAATQDVGIFSTSHNHGTTGENDFSNFSAG